MHNRMSTRTKPFASLSGICCKVSYKKNKKNNMEEFLALKLNSEYLFWCAFVYFFFFFFGSRPLELMVQTFHGTFHKQIKNQNFFFILKFFVLLFCMWMLKSEHGWIVFLYTATTPNLMAIFWGLEGKK